MSFYSGYNENTPSNSRTRQTKNSQGSQEFMDVDAPRASYGNRGSSSPDRSGHRRNQHHDPYAPHMGSHSDNGPSVYRGHQMMTQEQAFRSEQASKQMVYEVFGNVITMLEEYESRELKQNRDKQSRFMPRSDIFLPEQSHKSKQDIARILETQLLIFQTHLHSACRPKVRDQVLDELTDATKQWIAVRKDKGLEYSKTDDYAAQLYEIISRGKTNHPPVFNNPPDIDERNLQKAAQQYFEGDHRRAQLDEAFAKNPSKKASMPAVRAGSSSETGIDRIYERRPDLARDPHSLK